MQISASTVLGAQQQAVRVSPSQAQPADAFQPLNFKQAAKQAAAAPTPELPAQPQSGTGFVRPGTHIDIKV